MKGKKFDVGAYARAYEESKKVLENAEAEFDIARLRFNAAKRHLGKAKKDHAARDERLRDAMRRDDERRRERNAR
jgi:hypothetical protein